MLISFNKLRKQFSRLVLLVGPIAVVASGCGQLAQAMDLTTAKNLLCTIEKSSLDSEVGGEFFLAGLKSVSPRAKFESGNISPLEKVFDSKETLTLLLVAAGSGSADVFIIDKISGKFARASAGNVMGIYSSSSAGTCKSEDNDFPIENR